MTKDSLAAREVLEGSKAAAWRALCFEGVSPAEISALRNGYAPPDVASAVRAYCRRHGLAAPPNCALRRPHAET